MSPTTKHRILVTLIFGWVVWNKYGRMTWS